MSFSLQLCQNPLNRRPWNNVFWSKVHSYIILYSVIMVMIVYRYDVPSCQSLDKPYSEIVQQQYKMIVPLQRKFNKYLLLKHNIQSFAPIYHIEYHKYLFSSFQYSYNTQYMRKKYLKIFIHLYTCFIQSRGCSNMIVHVFWDPYIPPLPFLLYIFTVTLTLFLQEPKTPRLPLRDVRLYLNNPNTKLHWSTFSLVNIDI